MSYAHIPVWDRLSLAWQVRWGKPSAHVDIGQRGIVGSPAIDFGDVQGMHFGKGRRCDTVDRSQWPLGRTEPAAIYRRGNYCIVVPTVCGNISWATCHSNGLAYTGAVRAVPEPSTLLLTIAAISGMILLRGRFRASR
jgi:hypothetical protein